MPNYKNSNKMKYNLSKHRYILTPEAMEQDYGIQLLDVLDSDGDISPETLPDRFLDRLSLIFYNYLYSWAKDKNKTEYVLSLPRYREGIENGMKELCYAWLMNNTDPSVYFTGNSLKSIEVPPAVQTILLNEGLIFRGDFYNMPNDYLNTKGEDY